MGAAKSGNVSTVDLLIRLGASIHQSNNACHTAHYYAVKARHHEIIKKLEEGAPPPRDC
ncbi:MAG: ankyrin repeat domain-containing protein [Noviherbaspirillum sp.]